MKYALHDLTEADVHLLHYALGVLNDVPHLLQDSQRVAYEALRASLQALLDTNPGVIDETPRT